MWDLYNSAPSTQRDEGGDNAPPEFSPPTPPEFNPPNPSDFDANAWLNAAQRRHDAWDEAREQQQLLNTPLAQLMPQDLGAWAQAYLRSKAHEWTPEQASGFGYGFRPAEQEDNLSKWLEPIKRHYAAEQAAKPGTPTGEMMQRNEYGLTFPVTTPKPEEGIVNKWLDQLKEHGPQALGDVLAIMPIVGGPLAAKAALEGKSPEDIFRETSTGRLLELVGGLNEAADQVPAIGGLKESVSRA